MQCHTHQRVTLLIPLCAVKALGSSAPGDVTAPGYAEAPFDCKYAPSTSLDSAGDGDAETCAEPS